MRKITLTILAILFCLNSNIVWSADFQKGLTAARSGDFATALREWKPLARKGFARAQYNLGVMYDNGRKGVPQDYKTAVKWYKLAAEQENARAQYNLGVMYEDGKGVLQDYKTAVKWYKLAAEQGDSRAQNNLGVRYGTGKGVIKDYVYAHMWGNIALSNGNKGGGKVRDTIAKLMTPSQIETAQELARGCIRKKYKGCVKGDKNKNSSSKKTATSTNHIQSRLSKLKELEDAGLITKDEAAKKRKAILDSL
jgi:TPR repeat protein